MLWTHQVNSFRVWAFKHQCLSDEAVKLARALSAATMMEPESKRLPKRSP